MNDIYAGSKITNGKKLVELLNLNGEEVLMIGDTCHDFEVARAIGAGHSIDGKRTSIRRKAENLWCGNIL